MAAVSWQNASGGDWNNSANWSGNAVPTLADAVQIALPGTYTVSITTSSVASAGSLTITDSGATVADFGGLDLAGMLAISAGQFDLMAAGFVSGGTIETLDSGAFVVNGGTLEAVTYEGTLTVSGTLHVESGLTLAGSGGAGSALVEITSGGTLAVSGTTTLNDANIVFGNSASLVFRDEGGDTLTFGPSLTIDQTGLDTYILAEYSASGAVINSGTISAGVSGGQFGISAGYDNFINDGVVDVTNGDSLLFLTSAFINAGSITIGNGASIATMSPAADVGGLPYFTNSGSIVVESGGTLDLVAGTYTADLAGITVDSGGNFDIAGWLVNSGSTLTVGSGTNLTDLTLYGDGRIQGGTIVDKDGFTADHGILDDVTLDGTFVLNSGQASLNDVTLNNLAGDGPGEIDMTASELEVYGTLSHATIYTGSGSEVAGQSVTLAASLDIIATGNTSLALGQIGTGSLVNSGTIQAEVSGTSFSIDDYTSVTNAGSITVGSGVTIVFASVGTVTNDGTLDLQAGASLTVSGAASLDLGIPLTATAGGTISIDDATISASIIGASGGGTWRASGTDTIAAASAGGAIDVSGTVVAASGTLTFAAPISGSGTIEVDQTATLVLDSSAASTDSLDFNGIGGTLVIATTAMPAATISGLQPSDSDALILRDLAYSAGGSAVLTSGNILKITEGGTTYDLQLDPTQDFTGDYFHLTSASGGGTEIYENTTAPCYCRGTLVLTDEGERLVENLRIGDRLITRSGEARPIRWIGQRAYAGAFARRNPDILPIRIRAGAIAPGIPKRDLWVSPLHAMFIEGVLVPAVALVDGLRIIQEKSVDQVEYFHLELETHDIILAEGAWSESFVDDHSRNMFQNAAEYRALYPDLPEAAAIYCAPRVEDGEALESIRANLTAARATKPGTLRGHLDLVSRGLIEGWAINAADPATPVTLRVLDHGVTLAEVVADQFRSDLGGTHAFSLQIPDGLSPDKDHLIQVVRASDGEELDGSPWGWKAERSYGT